MEKRNLKGKNRDMEDDLDYLKEVSKLNVLRTCEEMARFGVNRSGFYFVDPDGPLIGQKPIKVYCEFVDGLVYTKISHNSEEKTTIEPCKGAGCYSRKISYDAPTEQIQSIVQLSYMCFQEIRYDCFLSPLQYEETNYGYWLDRNSEHQTYWTGEHYGQHVCSCHFMDEGCIDEVRQIQK